MPTIAAVALLPKAGEFVSSALGGLGIGGDTADDKRRKQGAASLEARALAGDRSAVAQLEHEAFDARNGVSTDARKPVDGKFSPTAVRKLAVDALKRLTAAGVPLTAQSRYAQLKVPVPQTQREEVLRAIVTPVVQSFAPELGREVATATAPTLNRAVIVGVVVVVVAVIAIAWRARA